MLRDKPSIPKRWLILSHAFNMDGRAASQTITDKIPYLLGQGIQLHVISAISGKQDRRFSHERLLAWGPAGLRFDFRHWFARRWGRGACYRIVTPLVSLLLAPFVVIERLALGLSSQWSWSIPAALRGRRIVESGLAQLVYSTGGAWSAHLAGWWIKKLTGAVWIAEIHDPLVASYGQSSSREARVKEWLERKVCTDADLVWWFTDGAVASARKRNPQLDAKGFAVLAGAACPQTKGEHVFGDKLNIGHFGVLSASRSLAPFLDALAAFCSNNPRARECIRLHVYGSALDAGSVHSINSHALRDIVVAHGRIERDPTSGLSGRELVLQQMQRADVLLLLHGSGPNCAEYIPSKLYEYFWTRRPVLALTHENSQLDALIRERGGYLSRALDQASIVNGIERVWNDWNARAFPVSDLPPIDIETTVATIIRAVEGLGSRPLLTKTARAASPTFQ